MARINEPRRRDNGRPVLIVMKYRHVQKIAQLLLDDKTLRRANIFEVNPAKCISETFDAFDKGLSVFFFDLNVKTIDIGKAFEENRLPFHNGFRRHCAEIT